MIQINLLPKDLPKDQPDRIKLCDAIARFREAQRGLSYTKRNPNLGRMVNCMVCGLRHRSVEVCEQHFHVGRYDPRPDGKKLVLEAPKTRNGLFGAPQKRNYSDKRINPHINHRGQLLIQRVREMFPFYEAEMKPITQEESVKVMQAARVEAKRILKYERAAAGSRKKIQQFESRRINRRK